MNRPKQGRRILWLFLILTCTGLLVVGIMLGLIGWTLTQVRSQRAQATVEMDQLNRASDQLRRLTGESWAQIDATFDENAKLSTSSDPISDLSQFVRSQFQSNPDPTVQAPLKRLGEAVSRLDNFNLRASTWRGNYDLVWFDIRNERTMKVIRAMIAQLRGQVDAAEGERRLAEAQKYRRWKQANSDEANRQAAEILREQAHRQSQESSDVKDQLAELARLVELLGGAEQFDSLADIKHNQLQPVLDQLSRSMDAFSSESDGSKTSSALTRQSIEDLKVALFGKGYTKDEAHQDIQPGLGGLFTLRRDALQLRRDRDTLKSEGASLFQEIEADNAAFTQSAQVRTVALTQQLEHGLTDAWRRMWILGGGCSLLFLWLAGLISRGINSQVAAIEEARIEAEKGRQIMQDLMAKEQIAANELAVAHADLQSSERRFRTLSASSPIGIFECDAKGGILYANPQWEAITGLSVQQSLGDKWQNGLFIQDAVDVRAQWDQAISTGQEFRAEVGFQTPAGESRWVSARTTTIRAESGEILGMVGTLEDISSRKHAEAELKAAHEKLLDTSRKAGMAEIATSVIHNVGNVLNSVNVSVSMATGKLQKSAIKDLTRAVQLIADHKQDLANYLTRDQRGKLIPDFLSAVSEVLNTEQQSLIDEMTSLAKNVDHIKQIVHVQQTHARPTHVTGPVAIVDLIEDALRVNMVALEGSPIRTIRELGFTGNVVHDKHAVLQILINLVSNAKHAVMGTGNSEKSLSVRTESLERDGRVWVRLHLTDNGVGITPENLNRIFNHGFTTKKNGHGFGLHSSANTARQLGGSLTASSNGPGAGATFTLELPAELEAVLA